MIGESMDMIGDASAAEEADDVYNQILGEVGLEFQGNAVVGTNALPQKKVVSQQVEEEKNDLDDLEARL